MAIEESSLKTTSSSFYQKQVSSMKLANLRDIFKKAYKGMCTSTIVVSSDTLSLAPTILAIKTPNTWKRTLIVQNQHMQKIPKWNTPLISRTLQIQEQ